MDDPWTAILDLLSQVVTPLWATLLQYIPLLLLGLTVLIFLVLIRAWAHNGPRNASRVPRPLPAGPVPAGVHLPSGSAWPFVAPIGLVLIFFALAIGGGEGAFINIPIAILGVVISAVGVIGWYLDANREYDQLGAHDHGLRLAAETSAAPRPVVMPEGIHLPGNSAWPFLAPIGLFFIFLGLALGPLLIVAGAVMAIASATGWYLDANREFVQVEAGHVPEPVTRDPVRVFPHRLVPVFEGVAVLAILLTLAPWLLTFLPQQAATGDDGPPATMTPMVSASSVLSFDQSRFVIPADTPGVKLTFNNNQAGVQHDVAIYTDDSKSEAIFDGEPITGVATIVYDLPPISAGSFPFICTIHPATMVGTVLVKPGPPPPPEPS
jgi:plastocyanin